MHPRVSGLLDALARERTTLVAAVDAIPGADRERRPTAESWTVAEVVEHLRLVEAGTAALLARRVLRAREGGVPADPETSSVLGRLDYIDVVNGGGIRVAPEIVRPRADVSIGEALSGLDASRAALLDVVRQLDAVDGSRVKATHAALGEIDAYQWLLFVAQHERRHARQIERIGRELASG